MYRWNMYNNNNNYMLYYINIYSVCVCFLHYKSSGGGGKSVAASDSSCLRVTNTCNL